VQYLLLAPAPFWVAALVIIWLTSTAARPKIPADAELPAPYGLGMLGVRLPRDAAFGLAIGVPLAAGIGLLIAARMVVQDPASLAIFVGVRILVATGFALSHLVWLTAMGRSRR
jgi:hypothetical protein